MMVTDRVVAAFDRALRATTSPPQHARAAVLPVPQDRALTPEQRTHAAALMRVNHVGEVCAQALYHG